MLSTVTEEYAPGRLHLQPNAIAELPASQAFEVITLMDVIEHVEKPDQLIAEAATRLVPGGVLVVETGNYQSAGRVQSHGAWWNYQLDHRWYFAPPQLRELLNQAGLNSIELADRVLRPWWKGQADMVAPRLSGLVKTIAKAPWRASTALKCHQKLRHGNNKWKGWAGLEIMTMVGTKA